MGIVLSKLCPELVKLYSVSIITLQNVLAPKVAKYISHEGARIITLTSWIRESSRNDRSPFCKFLFKAYVSCRILLGGISSQDYIAPLLFRELERQMNTEGVDVILSLGFPIQAHMAALSFKTRHSEVKWITYSTDTFFANINASRVRFACLKNWLINRRIRIEKACYATADYNFFSREIFNCCKELFSNLVHKCGILDYTISNCNTNDTGTNVYFDKRKINLLFAGGVGKPMRDSSYFAKVFSLLPDSLNCVLHLFLVPSSSPFFEGDDSTLGMRRSVVFHSPVSPEEMLSIMKRADILVNLGNDSDVFSPSKLFDYVATGKPLVSVTYKNRKKNPILNKLPNILSIENYGDAYKDAERLAIFCLKMKDVVMPFMDIAKLLPEYSTSYVAERLCSKIET